MFRIPSDEQKNQFQYSELCKRLDGLEKVHEFVWNKQQDTRWKTDSKDFKVQCVSISYYSSERIKSKTSKILGGTLSDFPDQSPNYYNSDGVVVRGEQHERGYSVTNSNKAVEYSCYIIWMLWMWRTRMRRLPEISYHSPGDV